VPRDDPERTGRAATGPRHFFVPEQYPAEAHNELILARITVAVLTNFVGVQSCWER
jgi:hypothetical protein